MPLETFGERLRWARQTHAQLSQIELRDRVKEVYGVSIGANYISEMELERGKKPSFEVVRAMAGVLGVSLDWLARFTQDFLPVTERESIPAYFSEEADLVAQLVDSMPSDRRGLVLSVVRNMTPSTDERQRRIAEVAEILNSIERELGGDARANVERIMRERNFFAGTRHSTNPKGISN